MKIRLIMVMMIIISINTCFGSSKKGRSNYSGRITLNENIIAKQDSLGNLIYHTPIFVSNEEYLLKGQPLDTFEIYIGNGFENDLIEIWYNDKQIYYGYNTTEYSTGISAIFVFPKDMTANEHNFIVRMNRGKKILLNMKRVFYIIGIDYLFDDNILAISATNYC